MILRIKTFHENKRNLTNSLREWVTDKSIPLEERLELFFDSKLGEHATYVEHFDSWEINEDGNCMYEPRKHETIHMDQVFEHMQDTLDHEKECDAKGEGYGKYHKKTKFTEKDIINLKEETLEKFIDCYDFDW